MQILLAIQILCWLAAFVLFIMSGNRRNWEVEQTMKAAITPFRAWRLYSDDTGYWYHMASLILWFIGGLAAVIFWASKVFA